jgi:hypothetical protein
MCLGFGALETKGKVTSVKMLQDWLSEAIKDTVKNRVYSFV